MRDPRDGRAETPDGGEVTCSRPWGDVVLRLSQIEARGVARALDYRGSIEDRGIAHAIREAMGEEEDLGNS